MVCCNMVGSDDVVPFAIGKSKKLGVLNNFETLPFRFDNSSNAWMTGILFNKWLEDLNSRMAEIIIILLFYYFLIT